MLSQKQLPRLSRVRHSMWQYAPPSLISDDVSPPDNPHQMELFSPMTAHKVVLLQFAELRLLLRTDRLRIAAAGMEVTTAGRIRWISDVPLQDNGLRPEPRVRLWDSR